MDVDTHEVTSRLQEALRRSGLSLRAFAAALGTSHSRLSSYLKGTASPSAALFVRALRLGAALGQAQAQGWLTPPATSRAISAAIADGDEQWAFKLTTQARDQVREMLASPDAVADAWEARPGRTEDDRWDTLLAALVGHEFESAGRAAPAWTNVRTAADWVKPNLLLDETDIRAATPAWLAERGIYIAERDLATA